MKLRVCIILMLSILLLGSTLGIFILKREIKVDFEYVDKLSIYADDRIGYDIWFPLNDIHGTEITTESLKDHCDIGMLDFEFEKYTYILVEGYELLELSYNHFDVWGRLSKNPVYHGRVVLKKDPPKNVLNVYRINADINIRNDIHWRYDSPRVIFVE